MTEGRLSNKNTNKQIYRFPPIHRWIEIMVNKELVLPRVSKWEDPAEGDVIKCLRKWKNELGISWNFCTIKVNNKVSITDRALRRMVGSPSP